MAGNSGWPVAATPKLPLVAGGCMATAPVTPEWNWSAGRGPARGAGTCGAGVGGTALVAAEAPVGAPALAPRNVVPALARAWPTCRHTRAAVLRSVRRNRFGV